MYHYWRKVVSDKIAAIRGMNDVLPLQIANWQYVERVLASTMLSYGYQEIRFPLVESTTLFKRSIGDVTDIVEKEMYTFTDLNGDSLTLRPEGTAPCVRACLEHGLLHNQSQKLWYMGPMFRHEKPQKGRYRQFTQIGVEALNLQGVAIELEMIAMSKRLWQQLGIASSLTLEINTLGTLIERQAYRDQLVSYFEKHINSLDEDSQKRLTRNPLRILDSKNPDMQAIIKQAPKLYDSLTEESKAHFDALCQGLKQLGIAYEINPCLVRGLDYYGHTVFEWVTTQLGSQATVCAGGRYDGLVEQLGGPSTPAVGFAMGLERLLLLMELENVTPTTKAPVTFFIMATSELAMMTALSIAEMLRSLPQGFCVLTNVAGGSFKSQFKKADKSEARFALILGDDELSQGKISIKDLRQESEQVEVEIKHLGDYLEKRLGRG